MEETNKPNTKKPHPKPKTKTEEPKKTETNQKNKTKTRENCAQGGPKISLMCVQKVM